MLPEFVIGYFFLFSKSPLKKISEQRRVKTSFRKIPAQTPLLFAESPAGDSANGNTLYPPDCVIVWHYLIVDFYIKQFWHEKDSYPSAG